MKISKNTSYTRSCIYVRYDGYIFFVQLQRVHYIQTYLDVINVNKMKNLSNTRSMCWEYVTVWLLDYNIKTLDNIFILKLFQPFANEDVELFCQRIDSIILNESEIS